MALRCFLYSSDEGTSDLIRQVIAGLGVEGEFCSQASAAVEKVTQQVFQLVVIDWDQQPEAGMILSAARERKVAERPLILVIAGDEAGVPKALQAGANSILRKPLQIGHATETLTTARDLLRSRQESALANANAAAAAATAAAAAPPLPARSETVPEKSLTGGEFLRSTPATPSGQFETESEVGDLREQSAAQETDTLKDLEPVAAAVAEKRPLPVPAPSDEPRGLEWHLKARGVTRQTGPVIEPPAAPAGNAKPELLDYEQSHSSSRESSWAPSNSRESNSASFSSGPVAEHSAAHEQKQEAQLFSYITRGDEPNEPSSWQPRIGKRGIFAALVLAACAIVVAPQAPWHGKLRGLTAQGQRALHGWLNPQPMTAVTQAPTTHEDFGRAGDEYKLPVAENIPDATTDPSQISVVPVIDPTAKKPPADAANTGQAAAQPDATTPTAGTQTEPGATPTTQPGQSTADPAQPAGASTPPAAPSDQLAHPDAAAKVSTISADSTAAEVRPSPPPRPKPPQYTPVTTKVPSSLQSQMVRMVPDASGNKPLDAALPSIEPVDVPELTERALLTDQPAVGYPANAAGKQGTVTLQVLVGRDGTVQDAKFLQGSLAFARVAIDGVKQWKFKPYTMNGRPVSIQTILTLKFAPAQ